MAAAPLTKTQPTDKNNIKRSVLRVIGLTIITSGLYFFYWFFVTKNQLKRELKNDERVGWQTAGLFVPILNLFVLYWLYRDINALRTTQKLNPFPAVWYVITPSILLVVGLIVGFGAIVSIIGAIASGIEDNSTSTGLAGAGVLGGILALLLLFTAGVLHYVFWGLAIKNLNVYWDKRSGGKAVAAKYHGGEIAIIIIGVLLLILNNSGTFVDKQDNDFQIDSSGSSMEY